MTFATYVTEARPKTQKAKREKKIQRLKSKEDHWSGLEEKEYMDPVVLHFKARETFTTNFLDRLNDFLNSDTQATPLDVLQRIYVMYDEEVGQKR